MVLAALMVGGCIGDKSVTLTVPTPLGVGTYGAVGFGDACTGSKVDLCSPETVQRIESITVEPPGMLEIVPVDSVPPDLQQVARYETAYAVHALASGAGRVCMQGLFSDGTHRKSCVPAAVAEIAHVTVTPSCPARVDDAIPQPLVPQGLPMGFEVEFQAADGTLLGGDTLHAIDDGPFTQTTPQAYVWTSPADGGSVTFGSPLDRSFSQTLSTYAPADVTAIHAAATLGPPITLTAGQDMNFDVVADVGDRRSCVPPAISIRTDTPSVCTGPKDSATTWMGDAGSVEDWFAAASEGTCRLAFGIPSGSGDLGTLEVPYYIVDGSDFLTRDQSAGDLCASPNQHVCSRDRATVLVCQSKKWAVATKCSSGICDYTAPASACPSTGCAACR